MCEGVMVCHSVKMMLGKTKLPPSKTAECGPRPFFITEDGKYAIPADLVKFDDKGNALTPDEKTPKYRIKILPPLKKKAAKKTAKKAAKKSVKKTVKR